MDHIWVTTANTAPVLRFKIRAARESDAETIYNMIGQAYADKGDEYQFESTRQDSITDHILSDDNRSFTLFLLEPPDNYFRRSSFKLKFKPIKLDKPIETVKSSSSSSSSSSTKEDEVGPAGLVLFSLNYTTLEASPGFSIQDLIVKEIYQKIGLEELLVKAVVAQAEAMGYGRVEFMPIDPDEDGSKLSTKLGVYQWQKVHRLERHLSEPEDIDLSPPKHFKIRPAGHSDAKFLNQLIQEMAETKGLKDQCPATEETIADTLFSDNESFNVLLLEVSKDFFQPLVNADQPVTDPEHETSKSSANEDGVMAIGFVLFYTTFSTYTMEPGFLIEDLFVSKNYEGMELEKHLVLHAVAEAKTMEYEKVELVTTYSKEDAINLKKKLGFCFRSEVCRLPIYRRRPV